MSVSVVAVLSWLLTVKSQYSVSLGAILTFVVNSSEPSPISTKFFAITLPSAMLGRVMVYRASVPEMMENKIATISEMMVIVLFMNYYLLNYYYLLLSMFTLLRRVII